MTPIHRLLLLLPASSLAFALLATACSSDVTNCESCGISAGGAGGTGATTSSTASGCTDTVGHLTGDVYLFEAPGMPNSKPAPKALIHLQASAGGMPITGMADDSGHYDIELPPGDWTVSGEEASGCFTLQATTVAVTACQTTDLNLVLEECTG